MCGLAGERTQGYARLKMVLFKGSSVHDSEATPNDDRGAGYRQLMQLPRNGGWDVVHFAEKRFWGSFASSHRARLQANPISRSLYNTTYLLLGTPLLK